MDIRDIESGMDSTDGTVTTGELLYTAADMQAAMEAGFREGFWDVLQSTLRRLHPGSTTAELEQIWQLREI